MSTGWVPRSYIANLVYHAGFEYNGADDIIQSRMYAHQRPLGFCWAYDVASPFLSMIIDAEPFYFSYGGKQWLLELWKGQYGLETGCEIGLYGRVAANALLPDASQRFRWYDSAYDHERPMMSFTLFRNGERLFKRGPELHWWLTGFRWGLFTALSAQLVMHIDIDFPAPGMRDAFREALAERRYQYFSRGNRGITFDFRHTTVPQPGSRKTMHVPVQTNNFNLVSAYNALKRRQGLVGPHSNDPNNFDQWDKPAARIARRIVAGAKKVQEDAGAAARRFGARAPIAAKLGNAAAAAAGRLRDEVEEQGADWMVYEKLAGFFGPERWKTSGRV